MSPLSIVANVCDTGEMSLNVSIVGMGVEIGLSSLGVLLILITIMILRKKPLKSAYTQILVNTALLDNIFLLSLLASNILYLSSTAKLLPILPLMSMIPFVPLTLTILTAEVYMVAVLMIKKVIALLEPGRFEQCLSERKTLFIVISVWVLSASYNLPHWWAYMPAAFSSQRQNFTWPHLWRDDSDKFKGSYFYKRVYGLYLLCVFELLVPISVFIAGLVLLHNSRNSRLEDDEDSLKSLDRRQWAMMNRSLSTPIWYIVMLTLLSRLVTACFLIARGPKYCPEVHACLFSENIVRLLYICNAFIKFLIYVFCLPSFRKAIQVAFSCTLQRTHRAQQV